jgi:hypothetical protein
VAVVGALLAVLVVLSFWPAAITDHSFGTGPARDLVQQVGGR